MYFIVSTTTDNKNVANSISEKVLALNISPCVQIIPNIESYYTWNEKTETSNEYLIQIKTIEQNITLISDIIKDNHNYETPEIISHKINLHSNKYKKWFIANSKGKE